VTPSDLVAVIRIPEYWSTVFEIRSQIRFHWSLTAGRLGMLSIQIRRAKRKVQCLKRKVRTVKCKLIRTSHFTFRTWTCSPYCSKFQPVECLLICI